QTVYTKEELAPQKKKIVRIPTTLQLEVNGDYYITCRVKSNSSDMVWDKGETIAYDQILLKSKSMINFNIISNKTPKVNLKSQTIDVSSGNYVIKFDSHSGELCEYSIGDNKLVENNTKPNLWRVPIDNDGSWDHDARLWRNATITYSKPQVDEVDGVIVITSTSDVLAHRERNLGAQFIRKYRVMENGVVDVEIQLRPYYYSAEGEWSLPRLGEHWQLSKNLSIVSWFGRGPWENYSDRKTSALVGNYSMPIDSLSFDYIRPQENGYRTDVRVVELANNNGEGLRFTSNNYLCFSASSSSQEEYFDNSGNPIRNSLDLTKTNSTHLNLDFAQQGVGGDNSWGRPVHIEYLVLLRDYKYGYRIEPINRLQH
ncbi:MAG: beta-galactosidase small subunit, partial [Bacteroidales bacterium]